MAVYEVRIDLKEGVLDAEGKNTLKALGLLGFEVESVKTSKLFRITTDDDVEAMCERLLANPVIHDFSVTKVE